MLDGLFLLIRFQVALCHVGFLWSLVNEYVIPWPVLGRMAARHLLIPLFASLKYRVCINDHATVIEESVMNHLPNTESGPLFQQYMLLLKLFSTIVK